MSDQARGRAPGSGDASMPQDDVAANNPALQPETQGEDPFDAAKGEEGQGDVEEEDEAQHSGDAPSDLRTSAPPADGGTPAAGSS